MQVTQRLDSKLDASVNWIFDNGVEARYVQRVQDYFIVYLSSHTGCNKACRFCHLTQTGQTSFQHVTLEEYKQQAEVVLAHYDNLIKNGMPTAVRVNFNFMSRGEPLANPVVLENLVELERVLGQLATKRGLAFKLKISSIIPMEAVNRGLDNIFHKTKFSQLYYSLYSVDTNFRKRWLPRAANPDVVMEQIRELQEENPMFSVVLHWALIEGENDQSYQIDHIGEVIRYYGIKARFNLVRYNPFSEDQGKESSAEVLDERLKQISFYMRVEGSKMIPKVGFDVQASCGMFVPGLT